MQRKLLDRCAISNLLRTWLSPRIVWHEVSLITHWKFSLWVSVSHTGKMTGPRSKKIITSLRHRERSVPRSSASHTHSYGVYDKCNRVPVWVRPRFVNPNVDGSATLAQPDSTARQSSSLTFSLFDIGLIGHSIDLVYLHLCTLLTLGGTHLSTLLSLCWISLLQIYGLLRF